MMKKNKILIITTILCLLPLLFSAIVYKDLPDPMAVQWSSDGTPSNFASRQFAALGLPLFMAAANLLVQLSVNHDPKYNNVTPVLIAIGRYVIPVITLILMPVTLLWNLNIKFPIEKIAIIIVGIIFIITGNYLPKTKQSYTVGIKLPWTLHSEENWKKTHHLGGYLFVISGIITLANCFIDLSALMLISLAATIIVPAVYSFLLYRKGI